MSSLLSPQRQVSAGPTQVTPCEVGGLNDLVYGFADNRLARIFSTLPEDHVHAYGIRSAEGALISGALAVDVETDCSVEYVATHPDAQRCGHATSVLRWLLAEACDRGCRTTSLRASAEGEPLYLKLGYRTVAQLQVRQLAPA
jgi:GNAT superfamily N-acetyltransferase